MLRKQKERPDVSGNECQSCGTAFMGKYCYRCGEKQILPSDFSLSKFLSQTVDVFTHFDGKFFASFKYLLFYPGRLTCEYLAGRRVKLMKPVQLYVVVALAFFFLFKDWDIFYTRTQYIVLQKPRTEKRVYYKDSELQGYHAWMKKYIVNKARKRNITFEQMVYTIDSNTPSLSKAFIFLIIPVSALFLYATGFRKYPYYSQHLFHTTHLFTFYLAASIVWIGSYGIVVLASNIPMNYSIAFIPVNVFFLVYVLFSIKRVYNSNWLTTILRSLLYALGSISAAILYNKFITYLSVIMA